MRIARLLTPSLMLGDTTPHPHVAASTADEAEGAIRGGGSALVADPGVALETLTRLGMDQVEAQERIRWASGLVARVDLEGLNI
jgi:hypothetical protein